MTDERRNEIWALLPSDYQTYVKRWYQDVIDNNEQTEHIFEGLFGKHNLTAQAEEKPKDESILGEDSDVGKFDITSFQYNLDYAAYRLDLAKELAVAMVGNYNDTIPDEAVSIANEIVKRLKETEI